MDFKVGDQVTHWSFGPGKIIQLDEKEIAGRKGTYYIVKTNDLTIWVPVKENGETSGPNWMRWVWLASQVSETHNSNESRSGGLALV